MEKNISDTNNESATEEKLDREETAATQAEDAVALLKVKTKLRAGGFAASVKEWQE